MNIIKYASGEITFGLIRRIKISININKFIYFFRFITIVTDIIIINLLVLITANVQINVGMEIAFDFII